LLKKPDLVPVWLAIEQAVMEFSPTGDPYHDGFCLARTAQGLMGQHGVDPFTVPPHTVGRRIEANLRDHCGTATPGTADFTAASWRLVVTAEGWHPAEWALMRYRWSGGKRATGRYSTRAQRRLACEVYGLFQYLPPDTDGRVYCSVRTLGRYLKAGKDTIALTLKALEKNGLITRHKLPSQAHADRFSINLPPDRGS
jgi:DNA-binding MarR family transcriptional regulator